MSSKANERVKGKGWFVNNNGIIYVQGTVEGMPFRRKSTGMRDTPRNIAYIKKNHREVLLKLMHKDKNSVAEDFVSFGRSVVEAGAKNRSELNQRDALSKFHTYLVPFFKEYALADIRAMHVEAWQELLLKSKSSSTVSKCKNLLRAIMHKACANDLIVKNPVEYADKIRVEHVKQVAYTVDEARRMMNESQGFIKLYLNVAFTTGMRTGELMALMWDDIDFENSCIYLQRSVSKGRMTIGSAGGKNHHRVVYLLPKVLQMLDEAKRESTCQWVFPSRKRTYYRESKAIVNKYFKPLLLKLGIEYKTLYATRHTFATIATNKMVNSKFMDSMVGNSENVRDKHYVTFEMTKERSTQAQEHLSPVNNAFFNLVKVEVK